MKLKQTKFFMREVLLGGLVVLFVACSGDSAGSANPQILEVIPESGPAGSKVKLVFDHFDDAQDILIVNGYSVDHEVPAQFVNTQLTTTNNTLEAEEGLEETYVVRYITIPAGMAEGLTSISIIRENNIIDEASFTVTNTMKDALTDGPITPEEETASSIIELPAVNPLAEADEAEEGINAVDSLNNKIKNYGLPTAPMSDDFKKITAVWDKPDTLPAGVFYCDGDNDGDANEVCAHHEDGDYYSCNADYNFVDDGEWCPVIQEGQGISDSHSSENTFVNSFFKKLFLKKEFPCDADGDGSKDEICTKKIIGFQN